jgi:predicted XRE-type DNA-binding protein
MNPYDIDYTKFKISKKITNEGDLLKLRLLAKLNQIIENMETQDILDLTGLDKSDLSRIRISSFQRFSIDRLLKIFNQLGYKADFSIAKKKKVS